MQHSNMKQERTIVITRNYMILGFFAFFLVFFGIIGGIIYINNVQTVALVDALRESHENINELTAILGDFNYPIE